MVCSDSGLCSEKHASADEAGWGLVGRVGCTQAAQRSGRGRLWAGRHGQGTMWLAGSFSGWICRKNPFPKWSTRAVLQYKRWPLLLHGGPPQANFLLEAKCSAHIISLREFAECCPAPTSRGSPTRCPHASSERGLQYHREGVCSRDHQARPWCPEPRGRKPRPGWVLQGAQG